jgi:hypothetical protein
MTDTTLDVSGIPPAERHPRVHEAFADLDSGDTLTLINDHEPRPLFYEMGAEVEAFDAGGYAVERRSADEFIAEFPKEQVTVLLAGTFLKRRHPAVGSGGPVTRREFPLVWLLLVRVRRGEDDRDARFGRARRDLAFAAASDELSRCHVVGLCRLVLVASVG